MAVQASNHPVIVSGPNAFYRDKDYEAKARRELGQPGLVGPVYQANLPAIEDRSTVISTLASVFFPGVTAALHEVAQRAILPSTISRGEIETISSLLGKAPEMPASPEEKRQKLIQIPEWGFKRITIEAGGCMVDAILVVKETNDPTRWTLVSQGNGGSYESQLQNRDLYGFLNQIHSNAILFNYPGVNSSTGEVSVPNLVASYLGTLDFAENALGAKQIIAYGFSIGGGVEGEAFKDHICKEGVKYLLIKDRTFSRLTDVAQSLISPAAKIGMNLLGWELDTYSSSSRLIHPEIIIQASHKPTVDLLEKADQIKNDGIIPEVDSLAFSILNEKAFPNKRILGVPYDHNRPIWQEPLLVSTIIDMLEPRKKNLELQKERASSSQEAVSPLPVPTPHADSKQSKESDHSLNDRLMIEHPLNSTQLNVFQTTKAKIQGEWQSDNGAMIFTYPPIEETPIEEYASIEEREAAYEARLAESNAQGNPPLSASSASPLVPQFSSQPIPSASYDALIKQRTELRSKLRVASAQCTIARRRLATLAKENDPVSDYSIQTRKINNLIREEQSLQIELREIDFDINKAEGASSERAFESIQTIAGTRLSARNRAN